MKNDHEDHEAMLWKLLGKEGLADLSQFHKRGFFDEVPLYSRASDVAFLAKLPPDVANAVLLNFAVKFLRAVTSYEEHRRPYFAAITVWSSEDEPIVPSLFIWSGPLRKLHDKLRLQAAQGPFARRMKRLVAKLRLTDRFDVLEDTATTPDLSRVFIGLRLPPYATFPPLDMFRRTRSLAKG